MIPWLYELVFHGDLGFPSVLLWMFMFIPSCALACSLLNAQVEGTPSGCFQKLSLQIGIGWVSLMLAIFLWSWHPSEFGYYLAVVFVLNGVSALLLWPFYGKVSWSLRIKEMKPMRMLGMAGLSSVFVASIYLLGWFRFE